MNLQNIMNSKKRLKNYPRHNSMRGEFGYHLYKEMANNKDIVLITADLGYGLFDPHRDDFADRFYNVGASEQLMLGMACGLALEGKIPVTYTITPFYYRAFETIRNYVDKEKIPVKMVGSGLYKDYAHDGFSHHSDDIHQVMNLFENITQYYPSKIESVESMLSDVLKNSKPSFIGLRR